MHTRWRLYANLYIRDPDFSCGRTDGSIRGSTRGPRGPTKTFLQFRNGKGMKKNIPIIQEREGNEKQTFLKFGNGKGMKNSIPIIRERKREAFILGNGREREFPLTPDTFCPYCLILT